MRHRIWIATAAVGLGGCQPDQAARHQADGTLQGPVAIAAKNGAPGAAAPQFDGRSQFTSIESSSCKMLEQNVEEGGWSRQLCAGLAGYKLEVTESDLRQDIIIIRPGGQRSELGLTEIVANGAFNALGKTAEWRGADLAAPNTLIVRLGVAADPEGRKPDVSNLIVARLKPSACIVAIVPPGEGQNEKARVIADGKLPDCLKAPGG